MTDDELKANARVQDLKPLVNDAETNIRDGLSKLSDFQLTRLIGAVSEPVSKRGLLKSLGSDPGHRQRIIVEQRILGRLRNEVTTRNAANDAANRAAATTALAAKPSLPSTSTWGRKSTSGP